MGNDKCKCECRHLEDPVRLVRDLMTLAGDDPSKRRFALGGTFSIGESAPPSELERAEKTVTDLKRRADIIARAEHYVAGR